MSSYNSYGSWSSKGTYSRGADRISSLNPTVDGATNRSNYGTLPKNYGSNSARSFSSTKPTISDTPKNYSRFSSRGYSVDRNLDRAKSPESDKNYRRFSGYTPPETPALRMGSSSRFGGQIARSPISEKSPTVFGISPVSEKSPTPFGGNSSSSTSSSSAKEVLGERKVEVITRSTSPTPPCNSLFLRSKRADMERVIKSEIVKSSNKSSTKSTESQTGESQITPLPPQRFSKALSPSPSQSSSTSWSPRIPSFNTPRYSSRVGGYSYSRPVDQNKCETQEKKTQSRPTDLAVRGLSSFNDTSMKGDFKKSPTDQKPPLIPNKDFRKSALNMDVHSIQKPIIASGDNKSDSESTSSSECSSSSEDSDENEKNNNFGSISKSIVKEAQGTKSVIVKALNQPVPMKIKYKAINGEDNSANEECKKPLVLRKFDSGDRAWWMSNKDIPSLEKSDKEGLSSDKSVSDHLLQKSSVKNFDRKTKKTSLNSLNECLNNSITNTASSASLAGIKSIPNSATNSVPNSPSNRSLNNSPNAEKLQHFTTETPLAHKSLSTSSNSLAPNINNSPLKTATSKSGNNLVRKSSVIEANLTSIANSCDPKRHQGAADHSSREGSTSLKKSVSSACIQSSATPLKKSDTSILINKSSGSSSSKSDVPILQEIARKANKHEEKKSDDGYSKNLTLRKFDSGELAFWEGVENKNVVHLTVSPKPSSSSENESGHNKLSRTSSTKSLCKPPIKKSESRDSLNDTKEYTPGYHRIHAKKMAAVAAAAVTGYSSAETGIGGDGSSGNDKVKSSVSSMKGSDSEGGSVMSDRMWPSRRVLVRVESGERDWWLSDEEKQEKQKKLRNKDGPVFIGCFTNIDHVLGTQAPPPAAFRTPDNTSGDDSDSCDDWCQKIQASEVKIHDSTARNPVIQKGGMIKLDDTALQLYKDGDYGAYLDLDASINEQQEEFESFNSNRKNSIVLRSQLSVRVHTIIEKLLNSEGRDLRRALFSLKQIFQEDKDLVHEFVQNDGLACLIKVGSEADQNYQNYILRALGQVMLYVDGMNGVIDHPGTVQWLYSLVSSRFRLVVKTALKLLLVFVEYSENNCVLLVKAIKAVDYVHTTRPWSNIMKLMKEYDAADTELLIYAMSLINKTLNGLPDQDMYYDQVDAIEEQGMESVIRRYMGKQGTDLDLLRQFQIYEAVLHHEDGEDKGTPLRQLDETIRKALRNRKSLTATLNPVERRKSRRYSTGSSPLTLTLTPTRLINPLMDSHSDDLLNNVNGDGGAGVTPGLRKRRERVERQKSFIREQREANLLAQLSSSEQSSEDNNNNNSYRVNNLISRRISSLPSPVSPPATSNTTEINGETEILNGSNGHLENGVNGDNGVEGITAKTAGEASQSKVKDLSSKLAGSLHATSEADGKGPFGEMKGIISKAKEELAKSQSRGDPLKSPTSDVSPLPPPRPPEIKKSETELHWESLKEKSTRPLRLCDLDFCDLASDDDRDVLAPASVGGGIPPPPPPVMNGIGAPPPAPGQFSKPPLLTKSSLVSTSPPKKNKKTVKLFWKEVRDDPIVIAKMSPGHLLWDELSPVVIDTQKLEHLFESRAKDLITKKQQEMNRNKEVIVLDHKRSNAINIGMTKLPPPRSIKTAILKMDATVMNREGIEKLLTMLPTEEERSKIQEAQSSNPDLPLGSAEQFLLTLASISELPARLKLWAFKLDYENSEKEIAEPLMDLKQGMETLGVNRTFRAILSTLLSIGIFLNGSEVKGFQVEYLSKVPEVKDTVHKHTLLHHLCHMVMEKFPDATDLYSEIGAITRASKVDFEELAGNIVKMEQECKASFDHLKVISKHDGTTNMKLKMSDFLADCAERIIVLNKVHRRVTYRFHKFCLWLGIPLHRVAATKPNELCRIISEFALEYRTTRERVLQQLEKKANHRERNKTRGKMITEIGKFRSQDDNKDAQLKQLLGNSTLEKETKIHGSLPWRRTKKDPTGRTVLEPVGSPNGHLTDADDEIIETLVKTATKSPVSRTSPRERKRTRNADRKSHLGPGTMSTMRSMLLENLHNSKEE